MKWKAVAYTLCTIIFLLVAFKAAAASSRIDTSKNDLSPDTLIRAPFNGKDKIPVYISFRIINLSEIDEANLRFNVVGYLLAKWKDPRLAFHSQNPDTEYRIYKPNQIWVPNFDFANAVVPHSAYDAIVRVYADGTAKYYERSSAQLSNPFYLHNFPFDDQMLKIMIQPFVSEEQLVDFKLADSKDLPQIFSKGSFDAQADAFSSLSQWNVIGLTSTEKNIAGLNDEAVNAIKFDIEIERRTALYIWKVFIPFLLMVILSWTALWGDPKDTNTQVQISVTTILTVIAFSFAISLNLPKVPYLTFIDAFFLTCYFFVFATAIEIILVHNFCRNKLLVVGEKIQCISKVGLPLLFLITVLSIVCYYNMQASKVAFEERSAVKDQKYGLNHSFAIN